MKKQRIVLASVLKPVDDTRMLGKMGSTLARDRYDVFIIGSPSLSVPAHPNIQFIPLKTFGRMSWKRLMAPLDVLLKVIKVKPYILLVNTHELLIVAASYKILFGAKIVYDIRENYYRNLLFTKVYPVGIRRLLAILVRLKEIALGPLFDHFILAEVGYRKEMSFFKDRFIVLENKSLPQAVRTWPSPHQGIHLLFSGTIDGSTGIFEAIALAKDLHDFNPDIRLNVVGYCALKSVRKKILSACRDCDFIRLIGFEHLVAHDRIMEEIRLAHFGIIYYPPSPHTSNLRPTKLYEYMASHLPILTWENQQYAQDVVAHQAGLLVSPSVESLLAEMHSATFYPLPIEGIYWEGSTLLGLAERLVNKK